MGFGGVPLKQHIVKNARKIVKTGAKNALDFFCQYTCVGDVDSFCLALAK